MSWCQVVLVLSAVVTSTLVCVSCSCNEAICASVVSKCMLTQSCNCDLKNCSCCNDCFNCLDSLYSECCSCVDMCPERNETKSELSQVSHVEDLGDPIPDLYSILTEEPDLKLRWISITFPVDLDRSQQEVTNHLVATPQDTGAPKDTITVNCTVAYMSQCMSWNKCKASCRSMGASSYRWFHDGCCECVGHTCVKFGINVSRCLECPDVDEEVEMNALADNEILTDYANYEYDDSKPEDKVVSTAMTEQELEEAEARAIIAAAREMEQREWEEQEQEEGQHDVSTSEEKTENGLEVAENDVLHEDDTVGVGSQSLSERVSEKM